MGQVVEFTKRGRETYGSGIQIGVIIQARMTSKRFPGKSLAMLNGKPVIQHVIERAKLIRGPIKVKKPIKVIVAVPDTDESEPLLKLIDELGVYNYCGPEENVLKRYYEAATFFKLDVIMRITGDCPLIDPKICSEVLQLLLWRRLDYTSNIWPDRTFPQGLDCECFTFDCLELTNAIMADRYKNIEEHQVQQLKDVLYSQEHVTPFMQREPEIKKALVKCMNNIDNSHLNYCIDFQNDIKRLEDIINKEKKRAILKVVSTTNLIL